MGSNKKSEWPGATSSGTKAKPRTKSNTVSKSIRVGERKTIKILMGSGGKGKSKGKKAV